MRTCAASARGSSRATLSSSPDAFPLDASRRGRVPSSARGGRSISEPADIRFKQLEESVTALVDRYRRSQLEIASLRRDLAERDERLRRQDREIRALAERRDDAAKRLDQLIAELDRLDAELAQGEEAPAPRRAGSGASRG